MTRHRKPFRRRWHMGEIAFILASPVLFAGVGALVGVVAYLDTGDADYIGFASLAMGFMGLLFVAVAIGSLSLGQIRDRAARRVAAAPEGDRKAAALSEREAEQRAFALHFFPPVGLLMVFLVATSWHWHLAGALGAVVWLKFLARHYGMKW